MIDLEKLRMWDDPGETICEEAANEIGRLRAALDIARSALLRIEQGSEAARASLTRAVETLSSGKCDDR